MKNSTTLFKQWLSLAKLTPKDFQLQGVQKMLNLEIFGDTSFPGVHGGLLCDEMGLGKTIQMLGLIYSNLKPRTLIVLPNALLDQWEHAIIRFFGHKPFVYHRSRKYYPGFDDALIVLTTYGTLSSRKVKGTNDMTPSKLLSYSWDRVIYDEAHHLRNKKTSAFHAADHIKSTIRWFVTGTPIQNKIQDLYSLLHLLPLQKNQYSTDEKLIHALRTFRIGRTKRQVGIDLPDLHTHNIMVDWETHQEMTLAKDLHSVLQFTNISYSNIDTLIQLLTNSHLPALLRMRQSCILPSLFQHNIQALINDGIIDAVSHSTIGQSKINAIIKHILSGDPSCKKIVFCHFRKEIRLIHSILTGFGLDVDYIDGGVSHSKRRDILSRAPDVLILQIQTANEGLNLQSYNHIYFSSPHWNPAVEDQAIARAHRIGQDKQVKVFRFIMNGFGGDSSSIEQYIYSIQDKKRTIYHLI